VLDIEHQSGREERLIELERDVWSITTLIDNVLREPDLISEEDRLSLFVLGVQLTEEFGDDVECDGE